MGAVAARFPGLNGPEPVTCKREGEDVYHRILATCFVRAEDIQRWMVAQGHALAFTRYSQAYASDCSHTVEASSSPVAPAPPAERGTAPAGSGPPSPECRIKGNVNQAGERIYHLPSSPDYDRIVMRLDRGKRWFCDEAEARAAGWRPRGIGANRLCCDEVGEVVVVPCGNLSPRRMESLPGALRVRFSAMCLMVVKLAGAWSVRMRHSSSRKTISMTQCRLWRVGRRISPPASHRTVREPLGSHRSHQAA